jgi:ATP-dependent DNA helicase RecQ
VAGDLELHALDLLRRLTRNPHAAFRDGQLVAISTLVEARQRVLCVQRTGWGKSAVYFIATALLRKRGSGPTLLISPLLALMRNQIAAAQDIGTEARTVNSSNRDEWEPVFEELRAGMVDLLLISPERLNNPRFRAEVLPTFIDDVGLLVVDEAHCISDWGHDFRPDYRRIARVVDRLGAETAVLCTTATANDRVVADIEAQLSSTGAPLVTIRGTLDRRALRLEVVRLPSAAERLAWLATHLPQLPGSGIVYCLTVRDTELVAGWLRRRGIAVEAYSGESDSELRPEIEGRLLRNAVKAVVATSALGMGYDKPDLGFVVHFQSPGSPIAYYQQVGRAGRQLAEAHGILLRGAEDREIQDYFIDVAFPPRAHVEAVLDQLRSAEAALSLRDIEREVNIRHGRLEAMMKVLEVEGAVVREDQRWSAAGAPWEYDEERVRNVTATRRAEQAAMERYADGRQCLMQFLRAELDDPGAAPCGRCAVCTEPRFAAYGPAELVREALEHIRNRPIVLKPRKRWAGLRSGTIPAERRAEPGRALSEYDDPGWGRLVSRGKWRDGRYGDELVTACATLVARWQPEPPPEWIAAVPSLERPVLVPEFAERLAAALELPFVAVVAKTRHTAPQKSMENSAQQADNVIGAFGIRDELVQPGPLLLVDDVRDSGWTMTVVADLLREAGSGPVHPLVLAVAGGRG